MITRILILSRCIGRVLLGTTYALAVLVLTVHGAMAQAASQPRAPDRVDAIGRSFNYPATTFDNGGDQTRNAKRERKDDRMRDVGPPITDPGLIANGAQEDVVIRIVNYVNGIQPLPLADSTAVIVGTAASTTAHVGYDKSSIYYEVIIRVDDVLKEDKSVPIAKAGAVTGTREGGTVKFPSGHTRHYLRADQGVVEAGRRYVFFLWRDPSVTENDYGIMTAYCIEGSRVIPLDKGKLFQRYHGSDPATFVGMIRNLASNEGGQP